MTNDLEQLKRCMGSTVGLPESLALNLITEIEELRERQSQLIQKLIEQQDRAERAEREIKELRAQVGAMDKLMQQAEDFGKQGEREMIDEACGEYLPWAEYETEGPMGALAHFVSRLKDRAERAEKALAKFGEHDACCKCYNYYPHSNKHLPCSCGLDAALKGEK